MQWTDDAIVLSARPYGEGSAVLTLMTRAHGRHAGLIRGQKVRQSMQPGVKVVATWRGRLEEHLGTFAIEVDDSRSASLVYDDPLRLAALAGACALVEAAAPERAPMPEVFEGLSTLLDLLPEPVWDAVYVRWELGLLGALGFHLSLEHCAATGANDHLAYVSPRTGRAVSLSAGEPYRDKLLPLPAFLIGRGDADPDAVHDGLTLTGYFLDRGLFAQTHSEVPAARQRFVDRYRRLTTRSGIAPVQGDEP